MIRFFGAARLSPDPKGWPFDSPFFQPEDFLLVKERVEMDINGYSLACAQESGENG
jgi:hypothetical protein